MDTFLNRYRNITVLLLVIFAQLVLLAYQVKNDSDVRLIRIWAVTAVTPLARTIEGVRGGTEGFLQSYVVLRDTRSENQHLRTELGRLKIENQRLKTELATADRAKALSVFESQSPSKMIAARVIMTALGSSGSAVFVDRGSVSGVEKGMAVVTPDGIVGKVLAAYPTASQVLLATDPSFAAGVVSQKNHVHGILKGVSHGNCRVDYVQNEEKVESGEWFYTSGEDRIFPKGLPAGQVTSARSSNPFQEIMLEPSGLAGGLEEVLIIVQGVHQQIPDLKTAAQPVYLAPPAPSSPGDAKAAAAQAAPTGASTTAPVLATDADKIREHYQELGAVQNHKFGDNPPGTKAVDFNLQPAAGAKPAEVVKPGGDRETGRGGDGGVPKPKTTAPDSQSSKPTEKKPAGPVSQPKPATANPPAEQ